MRDLGDFSDLVGQIYDAALDPARWFDLTAQITRLIGWSAAAHCSHTPYGSRPTVHAAGLEKGDLDAYLSDYQMHDPAANACFNANAGTIIIGSHLVSPAVLAATRYQKEWARSIGIVDSIHLVIDESPANKIIVALGQRKGDDPIDDTMLHRLATLMPHMRRSTRIGATTAFREVETATFAEVLDGLDAAIFLVDGLGRMVHANGAAETLLQQDELIYLINDKLFARDLRANRILWDIFASQPTGDEALAGKVLDIALTATSGDRYVAHILSLSTGTRRSIGQRHRASAAIFMKRAIFQMPPHMAIIAENFGLTPMELSVLRAVVEKGGAPEVARTLGIGLTTVKTHLANIYDKTGMNRHADLTKLVAAFASPLGRPRKR